jgi:hypothetical protein
VLDILISRDAMISALAQAYGVPERMFRVMDQEAIDRAWLCIIDHWGMT